MSSKNKKLQVFVSSTFTDLIEERQAAVEAILSSGNIPAGMELFTAGDESQMAVIERWIDESDVYLLLLGGRYGSIEKNSGKSYTQLEYEYAVKQGKPLFAIVIKEDALEAKVRAKGTDFMEKDNPALLKAFRADVLTKLVKFWGDNKDIQLAIYQTLSEFNYRKELVGWIRGDNQVNTGVLAEEIARLTKENHELRLVMQTLQVSNSVKYGGLAFEELEDMLISETIPDVKSCANLFDFLKMFGNKFTGDFFPIEVGQSSAMKILATYKLVQASERSGRYKFTDEGHNFYLQLMFREKQIARA